MATMIRGGCGVADIAPWLCVPVVKEVDTMALVSRPRAA